MVPGTEGFGRQSGIGPLVGNLKGGEPHSESADFLLRALNSKAEYSGRVHSSTEKHAHWNVRDHVLLDCFRQKAEQFTFCVLEAYVPGGMSKLKIPVLPQRRPAVLD